MRRTQAGKLGTGRKPQGGKLGKKRLPPGRDLEQSVYARLSHLGAKLQPGSGNLVGRPGDVIIADAESFLIEAKDFPTREIQIKTAWLAKIAREARDLRRRPALVVRTRMAPPTPDKWAVVPLSVLVHLIEKAGWEWEGEQ